MKLNRSVILLYYVFDLYDNDSDNDDKDAEGEVADNSRCI